LRASDVKIYRAMGFGTDKIAVGKLSVKNGVSASGYGLVVRPSEWVMVSKCPDNTYILSSPGLSPDAVR